MVADETELDANDTFPDDNSVKDQTLLYEASKDCQEGAREEWEHFRDHASGDRWLRWSVLVATIRGTLNACRIRNSLPPITQETSHDR